MFTNLCKQISVNAENDIIHFCIHYYKYVNIKFGTKQIKNNFFPFNLLVIFTKVRKNGLHSFVKSELKKEINCGHNAY